MYYSPIEEEVRFVIAEHERLCQSLRLQNEALQAAREQSSCGVTPSAGARVFAFLRATTHRLGTAHPS